MKTYTITETQKETLLKAMARQKEYKAGQFKGTKKEIALQMEAADSVHHRICYEVTRLLS